MRVLLFTILISMAFNTKAVENNGTRIRQLEEKLRCLVQRYGDFVRYEPPFKASTALLWLGPFVLLLGAGGFLIAVLRRRRGAPEEPALGPDDKRLVERVLGPANKRGDPP